MTLLPALLALPAATGYEYSGDRAVKYAKLAGAAYCSESSLESWNCGSTFCGESVTRVKVCQGSTTIAFVGLWENKGLVSFRGTHGVKSMIQDLKLLEYGAPWSKCDGCWLHSGFLDEWNSLESCVKGHLSDLGGSTIRTTGHSLGAALSIIAAVDLHYSGYTIEESIDFGRPRTGNVEFAQTCQSLFGDKVTRVTHHKDPVVQLPLEFPGNFEHSQPEVFYDGDVSGGYQRCLKVDDGLCSSKYDGFAFSIPDHLRYMDFGIADCSAAWKRGASTTNVTVV